jgi:hypothetical protein
LKINYWNKVTINEGGEGFIGNRMMRNEYRNKKEIIFFISLLCSFITQEKYRSVKSKVPSTIRKLIIVWICERVDNSSQKTWAAFCDFNIKYIYVTHLKIFVW